jgi:hypothetical protein
VSKFEFLVCGFEGHSKACNETERAWEIIILRVWIVFCICLFGWVGIDGGGI